MIYTEKDLIYSIEITIPDNFISEFNKKLITNTFYKDNLYSFKYSRLKNGLSQEDLSKKFQVWFNKYCIENLDEIKNTISDLKKVISDRIMEKYIFAIFDIWFEDYLDFEADLK